MERCAGAAARLREAEREAQEHPTGHPSQDEVDAFTDILDRIDENQFNEDEDEDDQDDDDDPEASKEWNMPSTSTAGQAAAPSSSLVPKAGIIEEAIGGLVTPKTRRGYLRLSHKFEVFAHKNNMLERGTTLRDLFPSSFPKDLPESIAYWIMQLCDTIDIYTGDDKHPGKHVCTFSHAQKMRAAINFVFVHEFGFGEDAPWAAVGTTGLYTGNPTRSKTVGDYISSLRRRKARSGDSNPVSARAIDESVMKRLYDFNRDLTGPLTPWAGRDTRVMLHCAYTIAMQCLLRCDEVLSICWDDITVGRSPEGIATVEIRLRVRKTKQFGDILPFRLYRRPDKPHLCAVTAIARWRNLVNKLGLESYGYVFRKRGQGGDNDRLSYSAMDQLSSSAFMECFKHNLLDIKLDPTLYGTHSFRRGGCQHLHMVEWWPIVKICAWGGWADDFDSPGTIFKYMLSWTDDPLVQRQDYLNPTHSARQTGTRRRTTGPN